MMLNVEKALDTRIEYGERHGDPRFKVLGDFLVPMRIAGTP